MTQTLTDTPTDARQLDAYLAGELERIRRENRIRKILAFAGLLTLLGGLGLATYLAYNATPSSAVGSAAPLSGSEAPPVSG